jgi:hypothetical protein
MSIIVIPPADARRLQPIVALAVGTILVALAAIAVLAPARLALRVDFGGLPFWLWVIGILAQLISGVRLFTAR